ncbi:hypothetical protein ABTM34_21030, partial [Acinetobacter baumannii]
VRQATLAEISITRCQIPVHASLLRPSVLTTQHVRGVPAFWFAEAGQLHYVGNIAKPRSINPRLGYGGIESLPLGREEAPGL